MADLLRELQQRCDFLAALAAAGAAAGHALRRYPAPGGDIHLQGECLFGNENGRPLLDKVRGELVGLIGAAPAVANADGAVFLGAMHVCWRCRCLPFQHWGKVRAGGEGW